jgi:hypothetical protein
VASSPAERHAAIHGPEADAARDGGVPGMEQLP